MSIKSKNGVDFHTLYKNNFYIYRYDWDTTYLFKFISVTKRNELKGVWLDISDFKTHKSAVLFNKLDKIFNNFYYHSISSYAAEDSSIYKINKYLHNRDKK